MQNALRKILLGLACVVPAVAAAGAKEELQPVSTLKAFHDEAELQAFLDKGRKQIEDSQKAYRSTGNLSGQAAAGATVVIENYATGFHREITADANGSYRVSALQPGTYKITAGGIAKDVIVSIGGTTSLDAVKIVGTGAIDPIHVESVESTTVLTAEQIENAPVPRDVTSVALLAPGTVADKAFGSGSDDITNVQTAGVDEGGIVKKAGEFLVVLRRGRLFTIRATAKAMERISMVNAYAPDIAPENTWYDEMLISGNTIVVIGYSYEHEGTEVGLFHLSDKGKVSYVATYHLYSSDYYSSRNYASRLVGNTLIFYAPIDVLSPSDATKTHFPGYRRWNKSSPGAAFQRIVPAERIYDSGLGDPEEGFTLHTVTRCKISATGMDCHASSVFGPQDSEFYVSNKAVYIWMLDWRSDDGEGASVVRMPLDESPPSALRVQGAPIDQLSFLEQDGYLNVLVAADAKGLRMWSAEGKSGGLGLLRVALNRFGDSEASSAPRDYRSLPSSTKGDGYWYAQNRFVGKWLLYGGGDENLPAYAVRFDRNDPAVRLDLDHNVERIEGMGTDALLVGSAKDDLHLSSVSLGQSASVASEFVLRGAAQAESRAHGFFYRPLGVAQGIFGLPVTKEHSASVQFLRNSQLRLAGIGELDAVAHGRVDEHADNCKASCYDWYGDSQPIFIGERVYGLLGYELVEGAMRNGRVIERRRVDFSPKSR